MKSFVIAAVFVLASCCATHFPADASDNVSAYENARQQGWELVQALIPLFEKSDAKQWPGTRDWVDDFHKLTKGMDAKLPVAKWPTVDLDALVLHNANYWRMVYETQPGDPTLAVLHAGLLLSQGEPQRAAYLLELARYEPGIPKNFIKAINSLQATAMAALEESNSLTQEGIVLYDKGDYDGAMQKYEQATKLCPQNGWALYEMGYTLRTKNRVAKGEPLDPPGTVKVNVKHDDPPEVAQWFAKARRADPLQIHAYQGSDKAVINGCFALVNKVVPAWKALQASRDQRQGRFHALRDISAGFQDAGVDDLGLCARQLMVAQRGNFDPQDFPYITTSLRRLAPGKTTEGVLERLAGKSVLLQALTKLDKIEGERGLGVPVTESDPTATSGLARSYMPDKAPSREELEKPVQMNRIQLVTPEDEIAKRTSAEELGAFIKKFKSVAERVLAQSSQPLTLRVKFRCNPNGHHVEILSTKQDVDKKLLQDFYDAVQKIDRLAVKSDEVTFEVFLKVTPAK